MRARARLVAGPDGPASAPVLSSDPPLVLRPAADAVYLAQGAAGPLGGDLLELDVEVPPGRALRIRAVAATLALPSLSGQPSRVELRARVGEGASLELLLEPVVVADGAWVELVTSLDLAADAQLLWREEVVLGRYGERGGRVRTRVDVELDDRPLLRTGTDLRGDDAVTRAASVLGPHRALGSLLIVRPGEGTPAGDPNQSAPHPDVSAAHPDVSAAHPGLSAAELALPGPGTLLTVAADSALDVRRWLDQRLAERPPRPSTCTKGYERPVEPH